MRVRGGVVTVGYPRFSWFDWRTQWGEQNVEVSAHWRKDRGEIALCAAVPWSIELRGGATRLTADLRVLRLESFEMRGGASKLELLLPHPAGTVPIRVAGGMNQLTIQRPVEKELEAGVAGGHLLVLGLQHKEMERRTRGWVRSRSRPQEHGRRPTVTRSSSWPESTNCRSPRTEPSGSSWEGSRLAACAAVRYSWTAWRSPDPLLPCLLIEVE